MSEDRFGGWLARIAALGLCLVAGCMAYNKLSERQGMPLRKTFSKLEQVLDNEQVEAVKAVEKPEIKAPVQKPVKVPVQEVKKEEISYKTEDFSKDSDRILMARIAFGEARNCSDEEMTAVAYTISTRASDGLPYNGEGSFRSVIFNPHGYSCLSNAKFNKENLEAIKDPMTYDPENFERALRIVDGVLSGKLKNPAPQANLYDLRGCSPKWLKSDRVRKVKIPLSFKHGFYREVRG